MLNHQLLIASMLGIVTVAGVGAYVLSGHDVSDGKSAPVATVTPGTHTSRTQLTSHAPIVLNLKLSPMYSLDKKDEMAESKRRALKTARKSSADASLIDSDAAARFAHVPAITQPLDLTLPPVDVPMVDDISDDSDAVVRRSASEKPRGSSNTHKLELNAGLGASDADSDASEKLFNRDNGLRGFMKQSWVSQNIGLQGGLAIKQERLREDNSDLQDNMAVGMGVLLAF